jgi:predicted nucleic acid-binding protein
LRLSRHKDANYQIVTGAVEWPNEQKAKLYFSLQNIAEFWNVSTRPMEGNGHGLSTLETDTLLKSIERTMTFLPDNAQVYSIWRQLVSTHHVKGVQVHDARLAAVMQAHGDTHILTLNPADFLRYPNIQAVHPTQVRLSPRYS